MTRLILLIIFFLIALLAVFKAPAYYLWLLAIMVTEYPLIFTLIAAVLTAWGMWVTPYRVAGNWIGAVTILLFLSPMIRAYFVGNDLRADMAKSFSGNGRPPVFPAREPFSFSGLLKSTPGLTYKTITYATYPDIALSLDFYTSPKSFAKERISEGSDSLPLGEGRGGLPCVIMVHGGSWSSGDSQQLPELNSFLAAKGYQVASINYRMAPKYQTPAPVDDIKQALAYLTKHADELNIDTNKFILLGRSAGAQIALLAAYTLHDKRIKGVVDFYGPADMVWGYSIPSNPLIMDSRGVMDRYIGGSYKQVPAKYVACSPIEFADTGAIPTLIIHGENDVLVSREHSRRLDLKLTQRNIRHYWLKLPWATHGFDFNINGPGGQLSTYAVETFLNTISQ
jgi:acetyl esterase/lipase